MIRWLDAERTDTLHADEFNYTITMLDRTGDRIRLTFTYNDRRVKPAPRTLRRLGDDRCQPFVSRLAVNERDDYTSRELVEDIYRNRPIPELTRSAKAIARREKNQSVEDTVAQFMEENGITYHV